MASKLLVIDDEEWITKVIERVADSLGFETMLITDSRKAAYAFFEFQPDLVVLDLHMPDRDGVYVLSDLLSVNKTTKIILISAGGEDSLRVGEAVAKLHGAERVTSMRKPFRRDELVALLTETIAQHTPDEHP